MTQDTKAGGAESPRVEPALVEEVQGKPPKEGKGRRVWLRIPTDMGRLIDQAGLHMSLLNGRSFGEPDILRMLLALGVEAYRLKHPSFKTEISPP